jgi:hypothetical protein
MKRVVDNYGKTIGYSINTNVELAPETYKDFDNWELTYIENSSQARERLLMILSLEALSGCNRRHPVFIEC